MHKTWWWWLDSSQRPTAYEAVALPLCYITMVPDSGNDPLTLALSRRCSTTELIRYKLVQPTGIEPVSMALQTTAMTTSARVAWGVVRVPTSCYNFHRVECFHYTNDTTDHIEVHYWVGDCAAFRDQSSLRILYVLRVMYFNMVRPEGFEPSTLWLKARYSTTELWTLGRGAENRTQNAWIKIVCDTISPHPNRILNC